VQFLAATAVAAFVVIAPAVLRPEGLVPCSKCHSHRISEIGLLWREPVSIIVRSSRVTPVTRIPT
jgi:hypothetical protein